MAVQETSLLAYSEAKKDISRKQAEVLRAIEEIYPVCNRQIAKHLGWEINSVTPRVYELRAKRKVVRFYPTKPEDEIDPMTGRKAMFWQPYRRNVEYENE